MTSNEFNKKVSNHFDFLFIIEFKKVFNYIMVPLDLHAIIGLFLSI
jgi:hypothetical protein